MKFKSLLLLIIILMLTTTLMACGNKEIPVADGILGRWFEYSNDTIDNYIFYEDGTYVTYSDSWDDKDIDEAKNNEKVYKFDKNRNLLKFEQEPEVSLELDTQKTIEVSFGKGSMTFNDGGETVTLFRSVESAKKNSPSYYTSDEFCNSIKDKDGYCIKDGIMYAYMGDKKTITIPQKVTRLYDSSFSGDLNRGTNLKKVIVPGTVKTVDLRAFSFCSADIIVFNEGVKKIGDSALMDSYVKEVWFPKSVTKLGRNILETEEGLDGCKIHVVAGSFAAKYFEKNMPYGDACLVYE